MIKYTYLDDTYQLPHHFRFIRVPNVWFWDEEGITQWLRERFGEPGYDNIRTFRYTHWGKGTGHMTVLFRDQIDAFDFKLRWWSDCVEDTAD